MHILIFRPFATEAHMFHSMIERVQENWLGMVSDFGSLRAVCLLENKVAEEVSLKVCSRGFSVEFGSGDKC